LSRHAKNELRTLNATLRDVEDAIADPIRIDGDPDGRPRYTSYIRGVRIRIVVAVDEPDLVVTIHERRN
jgi:uncharacterized protein DUF4258